MPNTYWNPNQSGRENAQKYLDYINENGYISKFDFLLDKVDTTHLAKLMPTLRSVVETAIGLESHDSRYFADEQVQAFHELIGGYVEENEFIPVRFGVKEYKDGTCTLYVVVCQEKIKTEVLKTERIEISSGDPASRSVNVSISHIIPFVNTAAHELISASKFESADPANHDHGWLDNNGQNKWDIRTVYI